MTNPNLTDREIQQVIAFLDWVGHIDTQGWPPRPILVSGASIPGTGNAGSASGPAASSDPVALGQTLYRKTPPSCFACHSTATGVNIVGPSLAGISTTAAQRIADPSYRGNATDAASYIRESILDPNAFVLQGTTYSSAGKSLMPTGFDVALTPEQVDQLVAYLMTLK
jgi:nitric oxide reductase subunit C